MPYKGTDRDAYRRAGQASNNPKKQAKLYQKYKAENAKKNKTTSSSSNLGRSYFDPPNRNTSSNYKPPRNYRYSKPIITRPTTPTPSRQTTAVAKPKSVQQSATVIAKPKLQNSFEINSFVEKQPFFATQKKKSDFANSLISKLQHYLVSKLTDAAEELIKIGVKKTLSSFLPTDLVDKIEKVYEFADTINTYIKVGQKVYQVITKITKHGKTVKVETYHKEVEYKTDNDYKNFYRNNYKKIKTLPSQINTEIETSVMEIIKVASDNKDFGELCLMLEEFQHNLIPTLAEKGYSLTDDLEGIEAFVMYDGKMSVGSIGLKRIDEHACEIVRVYIRDEYRGKGYAGALFSKIENHARKLGYKRAEMVTWAESTSALTLYKKLGYICSEEKVSEWFKGLKYFELHKNL